MSHASASRTGPHDGDRLDPADLRTRLPSAIRDTLASLDHADTLDSTNSELLRRVTPARGVAVLIAEHQTGGRGRQGRAWASPPGGNLYLSVARGFDGGLVRLGGLSLAVGVAVAEALHALGADAVRVKWPNDLVVVGDLGDGAHGLRKLGGILVEGGLQDGRARAIVGLGLNLRMPATAADGIGQPWTDLHALLGAAQPPRATVAAAVLAALVEALARFDHDGLAPFLPRFQPLDALRDAEVDAIVGDTVHAGIAAGLAADGALRLRCADGERVLRAGEISVRRRAAGPA